MSVTLDARPPELNAVPRNRSAVIEASAGTGKTYLIEHLALDLLISNGVHLDQLLMVTFTDKATAELRSRLRQRIRAACVAGRDPHRLATLGWEVDAAALNRLRRALACFDGAAISTLHGFCERLVSEHAFASGRLLEQQRIDERAAFSASFRDALRRDLTAAAIDRAWLEAWLNNIGDAGELENLLWACHKARAPFDAPFEPERFATALDATRALGALDGLAAGLKGSTKAAARRRLQLLTDFVQTHGQTSDVVASVTGWMRAGLSEALDWLSERVAEVPLPIQQLRAASVSLSEAVVQRFLPVVAARARQRKLAAGQFDFDDMLDLVDRALEGPGGEAIVTALRRRFRFAIIDEFQDTDPVQWRILRRVFFESGAANPLVVVGDPKQAIYGFRGADVDTYLAARREISAGKPTLTLSISYRSQPPLVDALNTLLDDRAAEPFLSGAIRYDAPVRARPSRPDATSEPRPPLHILRLPAPAGTKPRVAAMRAVIARRQAELVRALLNAPGAPAPSQVFVLARTGSDADDAADALLAAGVPCIKYKRDGLFQTAEAKQIRDVLATLAEPGDRSLRLRALLTPFFDVATAELPRFADLPDDHPFAVRLRRWTALAREHRYRALGREMLDASGLARRALLRGGAERLLTTCEHIVDVLVAETTARSMNIHELVQTLQAFIDDRRQPGDDDGGIMRMESDGQAVQVMTMHASKGLEAEVVLIYTGPTGNARRTQVLTFHRGGARRIRLNENATDVLPLVQTEQREEDQRLLYVAMTRARRLLVLPYFPDMAGEKLGCYRDVNRRLDAVLKDLVARDLATVEELDRSPELASTSAPATIEKQSFDWPAGLPSTHVAGADHDELALRAAGATVTSYTRMKREQTAQAAPAAVAEPDGPQESRSLAPPSPNGHLPGGAETGVFLHAVLEKMPLASAAHETFEGWSRRVDVTSLIEQEAQVAGIAAEHLPHARSLLWNAVNAPLPLAGGEVLAGLSQANGAVARELEFVYPLPAEPASALSHHRRQAAGTEAGFVRGFIDVMFEHHGRVYVLDWKSDALPGWDADTVRRQVDEHYDVQIRLYTFAALRMAHVDGAEDYERRFGGLLYVFLRGLEAAPETASTLVRPSYGEVTGWWKALASQNATAPRVPL